MEINFNDPMFNRTSIQFMQEIENYLSNNHIDIDTYFLKETIDVISVFVKPESSRIKCAIFSYNKNNGDYGINRMDITVFNELLKGN